MENKTGQESPQSTSITGYYKGFSVTLTNRENPPSFKPQVIAAETAIDEMLNRGWKPSWNQETNKAAAPDSTKWLDPPAEKRDPATCTHPNKKELMSHTAKNSGRMFYSCPDCGKFLGWKS